MHESRGIFANGASQLLCIMAIVLPPQARYNMTSVKAKVRNEQADTSQVYWGANLHTDFSFGSSLLPFLVGRARHHRHNGVGLISFYQPGRKQPTILSLCPICA